MMTPRDFEPVDGSDTSRLSAEVERRSCSATAA